jgi:hypothetical protein
VRWTDEDDGSFPWRTLALGAGIAVAARLVPLARWIFATFATLVHEMGHAACAWLFGEPAIPRFDLVHGGGFTSTEGRKTLLVALLYAGWAALLWRCRSPRPRLAVAGALALLWMLLLHTRGSEIAVLWTGQAGELVVAGIFLYRAFTGASVVHEVERPLYAGIGLFLVIHSLELCFGILGGGWARTLYLEGKGGVQNDFLRIARLLRTHLEVVTAAHLLAVLATPVAAYLAWWKAPVLRGWWDYLRDGEAA